MLNFTTITPTTVKLLNFLLHYVLQSAVYACYGKLSVRLSACLWRWCTVIIMNFWYYLHEHYNLGSQKYTNQ